MAKKTKQRASHRSSKKFAKTPILKSVFRGILRFFEKELPVTQFDGSGKYVAEVANVKEHQAALEAICGGRSLKAQKLPSIAKVTPVAGSYVMRVTIDGKIVGILKTADAKSLCIQLEKAELEPCALQVPALIKGGRRKNNGENEDFTVSLCLPPKSQKQPKSQKKSTPEDFQEKESDQ